MPLFDIYQQGLEATLLGASARGQALAANMANLNTPGYQRVDVPFHQVLQSAFEHADPAATDGLLNGTANLTVATVDPSGATRPDGNNVDMDQESTSIAQNALEYQAAAQLLGLWRRNLETVIRST